MLLTVNHSNLGLANEVDDGSSTDEERSHGAKNGGVELAKTEHVNLLLVTMRSEPSEYHYFFCRERTGKWVTSQRCSHVVSLNHQMLGWVLMIPLFIPCPRS